MVLLCENEVEGKNVFEVEVVEILVELEVKCLSEVAVEGEDGILDDTLVSAVLSRSEAVTSVGAEVDEKDTSDDSIVFDVFGEADVALLGL